MKAFHANLNLKLLLKLNTKILMFGSLTNNNIF